MEDPAFLNGHPYTACVFCCAPVRMECCWQRRLTNHLSHGLVKLSRQKSRILHQNQIGVSMPSPFLDLATIHIRGGNSHHDDLRCFFSRSAASHPISPGIACAGGRPVLWRTGCRCPGRAWQLLRSGLSSGRKLHGQRRVLAALSPDITQACTVVGDTAIVSFQATFQPNASTRYDIGMFISTDGTSALSGNSCYHDFLKPATTPPVTGPVNLTGGAGPFRNQDADVCADMLSKRRQQHLRLGPDCGPVSWTPTTMAW